jgi:hypothetical protein
MSNEMIDLGGVIIARQHIISAEIATRHYVNGMSVELIVALSTGRTLRLEHTASFDAYKALDSIKKGE